MNEKWANKITTITTTKSIILYGVFASVPHDNVSKLWISLREEDGLILSGAKRHSPSPEEANQGSTSVGSMHIHPRLDPRLLWDVTNHITVPVSVCNNMLLSDVSGYRRWMSHVQTEYLCIMQQQFSMTVACVSTIAHLSPQVFIIENFRHTGLVWSHPELSNGAGKSTSAHILKYNNSASPSSSQLPTQYVLGPEEHLSHLCRNFGLFFCG